jgi:hypothetical protein
VNILILGHAGSGKSTLVKNFGEYLEENYSVSRVNLDTATNPIYKAEVDSRNFVKTEEIMEKFGLGINGALLKSVELLKNHIPELVLKDDFALYDTPGQLELFLYTNFGEIFSEKLRGNDISLAIFLVDSYLCRTPENFLSAIFQSVVVSLRTGLQTLTVFNKTDLEKPLSFSKLRELIEKGEGVLSEMLETLLPFYDLTSLRYRTIEISAEKFTGFDELSGAINEIQCSCGDLS